MSQYDHQKHVWAENVKETFEEMDRLAAERDALRSENAKLREQKAVLLEACNGLITILERWAKNKEEQVTELSAVEFAKAFCSAKDAVAKAEATP